MLSIPLPFLIIVLALQGAFVLASAWAVVRLFGRLSGTPRRFTLSNAFIALATFYACSFTLAMTLRPLHWYNDQPQNWQSWVFSYSVPISTASALMVVVCWQVLVGLRQRRPHSDAQNQGV